MQHHSAGVDERNATERRNGKWPTSKSWENDASDSLSLPLCGGNDAAGSVVLFRSYCWFFFCCCRCRFPLSSAPVGFFFSCARSVIATLLAPLLIIRSLNRNVQVEQSDTARDGTRKPRPCVRGNWMENSFNSPPSRRRHRPRDMWHFFPQIFRGKPPKTTKLSERSLFKRVKRLLVWKTRSACSRVGFE